MFPVKTIFLEDALEITKHQPDGPLIPNRRLCLSRYRASTKYSGAPCSQAPKVEDAERRRRRGLGAKCMCVCGSVLSADQDLHQTLKTDWCEVLEG